MPGSPPAAHVAAAAALAKAACLNPWLNGLFLSRVAALAREAAAALGRRRAALALALLEALLLTRAAACLAAMIRPRPFDRDRSTRCPLGAACCRGVPPGDPLLPAAPVRCPLPPLAAGTLAAAGLLGAGRVGPAAASALLSLATLPFAVLLRRAGRRRR